MPGAPTARSIPAWGEAPGKIETNNEGLKARPIYWISRFKLDSLVHLAKMDKNQINRSARLEESMWLFLRTIPEIDELPKEHQARAKRYAFRKSFTHWKKILCWWSPLLLFGIGMGGLIGYYRPRPVPAWLAALAVGALGAAFGFVNAQVYNRYTRPYLIEYVREFQNRHQRS